jgi:hypothetical protein
MSEKVVVDDVRQSLNRIEALLSEERNAVRITGKSRRRQCQNEQGCDSHKRPAENKDVSCESQVRASVSWFSRSAISFLLWSGLRRICNLHVGVMLAKTEEASRSRKNRTLRGRWDQVCRLRSIRSYMR